MGPKRDTSTCIDELVTALKDERVLEDLGALFESKLQPFITLISELKSDNVKLTTKVTQPESDLISADKKIDALEAYTRADNLIIVGLPSTNYADAHQLKEATTLEMLSRVSRRKKLFWISARTSWTFQSRPKTFRLHTD